MRVVGLFFLFASLAFGQLTVTGPVTMSGGMTVGGVALALPGAATNPSPASGSSNFYSPFVFSWESGAGATTYNVYVDTVNPPLTEVSAGQAGLSYTATLSYSTLYYWRIDSVNEVGTTTGAVWSVNTSVPLASDLYTDMQASAGGGLPVTPVTTTFLGNSDNGSVTGSWTLSANAQMANNSIIYSGGTNLITPTKVTGITNPFTGQNIAQSIEFDVSVQANLGKRTFTANKTVAVSGWFSSGSNATVGVASVTVTGGGLGYLSPPSVTFTGGGGAGAAGTAVLSGTSVASVTITNAGTASYTTAPTVTFSGGAGITTATGTSVLNSGNAETIDHVEIDNSLGGFVIMQRGPASSPTVSANQVALHIDQAGAGSKHTSPINITNNTVYWYSLVAGDADDGGSTCYLYIYNSSGTLVASQSIATTGMYSGASAMWSDYEIGRCDSHSGTQPFAGNYNRFGPVLLSLGATNGVGP